MKPEFQEPEVISKIKVHELHLVPKKMKPEFQELEIISKIKAHELHLVPKEELTPENLLSSKDKSGNNIYFIAGLYQQEKQIPPEAYTREALASRTINGTPLICFLLKSRNPLPVKIENLTQELLELADKTNCQNSFHHAAKSHNIHYIQTKFLTPKNLSTPDRMGETPIQILLKEQSLTEEDFLKHLPANTLSFFVKEGEIKTRHLTGETKKRLLRFQRNQRITKAQRLIQTPQ